MTRPEQKQDEILCCNSVCIYLREHFYISLSGPVPIEETIGDCVYFSEGVCYLFEHTKLLSYEQQLKASKVAKDFERFLNLELSNDKRLQSGEYELSIYPQSLFHHVPNHPGEYFPFKQKEIRNEAKRVAKFILDHIDSIDELRERGRSPSLEIPSRFDSESTYDLLRLQLYEHVENCISVMFKTPPEINDQHAGFVKKQVGKKLPKLFERKSIIRCERSVLLFELDSPSLHGCPGSAKLVSEAMRDYESSMIPDFVFVIKQSRSNAFVCPVIWTDEFGGQKWIANFIAHTESVTSA